MSTESHNYSNDEVVAACALSWLSVHWFDASGRECRSIAQLVLQRSTTTRSSLDERQLLELQRTVLLEMGDDTKSKIRNAVAKAMMQALDDGYKQMLEECDALEFVELKKSRDSWIAFLKRWWLDSESAAMDLAQKLHPEVWQGPEAQQEQDGGSLGRCLTNVVRPWLKHLEVAWWTGRGSEDGVARIGGERVAELSEGVGARYFEKLSRVLESDIQGKEATASVVRKVRLLVDGTTHHESQRSESVPSREIEDALTLVEGILKSLEPAKGKEDPANPLMSEFEMLSSWIPWAAPLTRRVRLSQWTPFVLATLPILLALVVNVFAVRAGTAAVRVTAEGILPLDVLARTAQNGEQFNFGWVKTYGYVAELSHTFFYLLLAPIFIFAGDRFLRHAWYAIQVLHLQRRADGVRRISAVSGIRRQLDPKRWGCKPPAEIETPALAELWSWIAGFNRWSLLILLTAPIFCVWLGISREWAAIQQQQRAEELRLGYIQAPWTKKQVDALNAKLPHEEWRAFPKFLKDAIVSEFRKALPSAVAYSDLTDSGRRLVKWPGVTPTGTVANTRFQAGDFAIKTEELERLLVGQKQSVFTLHVDGNIGNDEPGWDYWAFFIVAVSGEALFHAAVAWLSFKAILWLLIVFVLLPGRPKGRFRFNLDMEDSTFRYGLAPVHAPYNWIMLMILVGASAFFLNQWSNAAKGTWLTQVSFDDGVGQILILVSYAVPLFVVLLGPIVIFALKVSKEKATVIQKMEESGVEAAKVGVARDQATWPRNDKMFLKMLTAAGTLVVLLGASKLPLPKEAKSYLDLTARIEGVMNSCAEYLLGNWR